jgi:hypothetical protein
MFQSTTMTAGHAIVHALEGARQVLHGPALAGADAQARPDIDQIERLVGGHRCVRPLEAGGKTLTHTSLSDRLDSPTRRLVR